MPSLVTKKEFATLCGISQTTLSGWIKQRIVSGEAFVGEGVRALIDVDVAMAQIKRRLDPGQSLGEGRQRYSTIKRATAPAAAPLDQVTLATPDLDDEGPLSAAKLRVSIASAEKIELANAATRRELLQAGEVVAGWSEILANVRARMLAVPSRVRQQIGTLSPSDVEIIAAEIRKGLRELADVA